MTDLSTDADLSKAIDASHRHPVVLFKHSRTCPISTMASAAVAQLTGGDDPDVYRIVVQTARALSNEVAVRFGIRHESPQVLIVREGVVIGHASHMAVSARMVRETVGKRSEEDASADPSATLRRDDR